MASKKYIMIIRDSFTNAIFYDFIFARTLPLAFGAARRKCSNPRFILYDVLSYSHIDNILSIINDIKKDLYGK